MKIKPPSLERIGLLTGVVTALALISYFLLMKVLGLAEILELRFFNFVIIATAIFIGIRNYKAKLHEQEFYLKGLGQGMFISAVTVVIFGVFMGFYLAYFDPALMDRIRSYASVGQYLDPLMVVFAIFLEGMASGAIITFAVMQYLKSNGSEVGKGAYNEKEVYHK